MAGEGVHIENLHRVLWALRRTDVGIRDEVKRASGVIARAWIADARSNVPDRQAAAAAQSLRSRKGLTPKVAVGGSQTVMTSTGPVMAGNLFGGSEFGSALWPQFVAYPTSHIQRWFYAGVKGPRGRRYASLWIAAVDRAIRRHWRN